MSQNSSYGPSQRSIKPLSREEIERGFDEEFPNRPRNHGKSRPFHSLFQELFNPLLEIRQAKPAGPMINRRKVGPDGQSNKSPSERRNAMIERYISRWRKEVGPDFFPALRLIIPDKDRDRGVYGLKEKVIAKLLIKIMKIDKNSEDAQNLLNWKNPGQTSSSRTDGNFAGRCHDALVKRPMRNQVGDMTIDEVNELLDKLSAAPKEQDQTPILTEFYKRMNADELQWLIRIILKQMKVGATERTFFNLWHPDAEALFNVSSNLRRVCWDLHDPDFRLDGDNAGVAVMQCFQPMLAASKKESLKKVVEALKPTPEDPEFWVEEKLDGERMQMHMVTEEDGKKFQWWSRKAKDYTYLYGKSFDDPNGALTQSIKNCFAEGVENIILDGEMITWDPNEKAPVPFGTLKTAALAEQSNPFAQGHRPVFRIFDILLLNGQPLTRYELRDRRKALAHSIKSEPERFEIHDYIAATTVEEVEQLLRKVVQEASEGLVLKNPRSMYRLDDRSGDWQKLKPEYMEGYGEELDCVIIGGYYGSGRRGGYLSSFLCGLRAPSKYTEIATQSQSQGQFDSQTQSQRRQSQGKERNRKSAPSQRRQDSQAHTQSQSQPPSQVPETQLEEADGNEPVENFITFFKVGGGMTANDYATIRHATDGKWHPWSSRRPAAKDYMDSGKVDTKLAEKPDMWIKPSDSVVVQVKAAQVVDSDDYGFKKTLRFPRFVKLRRDRDWKNALSVNDFAELKETAEIVEKTKKIEADEKRKDARKARTYASRKKPLTLAGYNTRDVNAVTLPDGPRSSVFEGLIFYIMTESSLPGDRKKSKLELEALVKANGGRIVQTATPIDDNQEPITSVICVASRRTVKVASLEKRGEREIIKPCWIFDCLEQVQRDFARGFAGDVVVPYEPDRHLFFVPEELKETFEENIDEYGDSYARDADGDELREIMNEMGTVEVEEDEKDEISNLFDADIFDMKGFIFHGMVFWFDPPHSSETNGNEQTSSSHVNVATSTFPAEAISLFAGARLLPSEYSNLGQVPPLVRHTITHVIAHKDSSLPSLRFQPSKWEGSRTPRIMSREWIEVCWREGTRVDEEGYVAR